MSERLKSLREKRAKAIADARGILEVADKAGREMTAEETASYDAAFAAGEKLKGEIAREESLIEAERTVASRTLADAGARPADANGRRVFNARRAGDDYSRAFGQFLVAGLNGMGEFRNALRMDEDTDGGFLVAPERFVTDLIKQLDNDVFVRKYATVIPVGQAASLGAPSLDADPADADWTSELATASEDSTMAFGKRKLSPHPLAKRIKISNELMRFALLSPEALVRERLAYKFGVTEEKGFLTGSGAGQPLGVFTASNDGIPTSRDVSTGNAATSIGADGLIEAKFSLKGQYQREARWLFHRDGVKQIAKLKDGDGQYMWQPGLKDGAPDVLLGRPVDQSEYAPNTFTSGQYVGLFGVWRYYWIADAYDLALQRLTELYAETNQTGFIGRKKTDGQPVLSEAFSRVKLG